jgi:hypothetical protein
VSGSSSRDDSVKKKLKKGNDFEVSDDEKSYELSSQAGSFKGFMHITDSKTSKGTPINGKHKDGKTKLAHKGNASPIAIEPPNLLPNGGLG